MGDLPLSSMEGLDRLKAWMRNQVLITLWDISVRSEDVDKTWLRWEANNRPPEFNGEWNTLTDYLQGKSLIKARKKDKRGWGSLSGAYTTTAGYKNLTAVPHVPPDPTIWRAIWTLKSIPKIYMFVWTLAHRSILIGENLQRRGWEGPSRCPLCTQEEETLDHLLLQCPYTKEVWQLALGLKPGTVALPQETNTLL